MNKTDKALGPLYRLVGRDRKYIRKCRSFLIVSRASWFGPMTRTWVLVVYRGGDFKKQT